ncbi:MAG: metal ABC transporter permease [Gammaproteobacteria bacterium]|nr:metal ABC transporter permease [Gammaproteobacteria bacterium]
MSFAAPDIALLDITILGPALLAGLLVVATHVPLGQQVLRRGIIFIDLAIAQIAGIGVIAAHRLGWAEGGWGVQFAAVGAALAGALVLTWTDRRWPQLQEALIGASFVLAATAAILLLSHDPHGGEQLKDLLVGQILWVTLADLIPVLVLYTAVLTLWFTLGPRLGRLGFYTLFAVAVTASVQLVGVYLVFASLIIPALATRALPGRRQLAIGYVIGAAGYALGLIVSALYDLPSGAVIVWALAAVGVVGGVRREA